MSSTTKIIKKEPFVQTVKAPPGLLLNTKKPIAAASLDVKPIISTDNDSLDGLDRKPPTRTYSGSSDRRSKSPDPNHSNLMYSNLKLPSPEPMEGMTNIGLYGLFRMHFHIDTINKFDVFRRYSTKALQLYKVTMLEIVL